MLPVAALGDSVKDTALLFILFKALRFAVVSCIVLACTCDRSVLRASCEAGDRDIEL